MATALYKPGDKILDVYIVERVLGAGGFSVVYLVKHAFLPRHYAAKVMNVAAETPADLERLRSRVEREATVLARFEHPNVPTLHDLRIENGRPILILENLVGQDLAKVLAYKEKLSVEDALYVGIEVAKPLYIAHQRDIIHRDIKPENVFCMAEQPPEGKAVIRLLDFGASRLLGQKGRITKEGMVVGTFHYMSPEALRSGGESDARADIYALGVVLWEALAGFHPYDPDDELNPQQIGLRHMEAPVPDIRSVRPSVAPRFADALLRMMAKHPNDRFRSMHDVYDELWATLSSLTHEAERMGRPLESIFTRQGVQLPSPDISPPSTKRRRRSRHMQLGGPASTTEMPMPDIAVAAWNKDDLARAVPASARATAVAPAGDPDPTVKQPASEAFPTRPFERPNPAPARPGTIKMTPVPAAPMPVPPVAAAPTLAPTPAEPLATVEVTTQEMVAVGALARTAIGASTIGERDQALLALRTRAPGAYRRVRLAMLVVEPQRDLNFRLDDEGRLRCLTVLESKAIDELLLSVAARGLTVSTSENVRVACAEVLGRHGDRRHDGLLNRVINEGPPPRLKAALEKALIEVRPRPQQVLQQVASMADEPLPIGSTPDPTLNEMLPKPSLLLRQDVQAVLLGLAVVLTILLAILGLR
ncbi:MAG: serine/threonine protein kinase [Polyangiaceae bacterium]|nr:serine/threonine protein kinase [Polyangiaceae bacterium]